MPISVFSVSIFDFRNTEFAYLTKPRGTMELSMLGLGGSIGTPDTGINASVMVVESFEDLRKHRTDVRTSS